MNRTFSSYLTLFVIMLFPLCVFSQKGALYNIKDFGAKGDGRTNNTTVINAAINLCNKNGGGTLVVPKGVFLSATIYLKSNVNIDLQQDAEIRGVADIKMYHSFIPSKDISRYNTVSTAGTNSNSAYDTVWTKALIIAQDVQNITISGKGVINGNHVFNSKGEEGMRGPHTIIMANTRNVTFTDVTIKKAANYAFLGYELANIVFQKVHIFEGWDGIHIRGGKNIIIRNCDLQTGDDAIAGGYWEHFVISDSFINSSCNGIRIIMPVQDVSIEYSKFTGPGNYPHRTSGTLHRTNMLAGIYIQPGGWGIAKGNIKDVHIANIQMFNMDNAFIFSLNKENNADNILVENVRADSIREAIYVSSLNGGYFDNLRFRNLQIHYVSTASTPQEKPWALKVNNVQRLYLENVNFDYKGTKPKTAMEMDNVAFPVFNNVNIYNKNELSNFKISHSGDIAIAN